MAEGVWLPPPLLPLPRLQIALDQPAPHGLEQFVHRSQVVPDPPSPPVSPSDGASPAPPLRPHRLTWAALLARVFALDVTVCPNCGGRLRWIAALTDPASVRRWVCERTHSWMNRFRRILIRWEKKVDNYLAFLHLACAFIVWRKCPVFG